MPTSELTFLYGQHVPQCTHRIDKYFEGYQTLQYMHKGAVDLTVGPAHYALEGQYFWSAFPGPRIRFHVGPKHSTWDHRYLAFRGPMVARWMAEGLFPIQPQQPPSREKDNYPARFDHLLTLSQRTDRWGQRRAIHVLEGLLIELAEARTQVPHEQPWLDRVLEVLDDSITNGNPDYASLASQLGLSLTTLRRRFRRTLGLSPHEYLLKARVNAARKMLAETDLPIKLIAQRVGYHDVFFFTRQFRSLTGVPPAQYRKSCQG